MPNELKPVTVKLIVWRDMTCNGVEEWVGHCALSQSFTIRDESELSEQPEYRFVVRPFLSPRTSFPTAAEAKAAAQADYERRILSAIEPAPAAYAQVRREALEEAAKAATSFLVGDPMNGVPLRSPMAYEIAEAIRSLIQGEGK
jgi:hypothetical protein